MEFAPDGGRRFRHFDTPALGSAFELMVQQRQQVLAFTSNSCGVFGKRVLSFKVSAERTLTSTSS